MRIITIRRQPSEGEKRLSLYPSPGSQVLTEHLLDVTMDNRTFALRALMVAVLLPFGAHAQYHSSISFQNGSGEDAVVKLVGPSARATPVPQNQTRSESGIAPGRYYLVVRYGDNEKNYSYTKGDPFAVEESGDQYSEISITLYKVPNGNYPTRPARKEDFDKGLASMPPRQQNGRGDQV